METSTEAEREQCRLCRPTSTHDNLLELHLHCLIEHPVEYHLSGQVEVNDKRTDVLAGPPPSAADYSGEDDLM